MHTDFALVLIPYVFLGNAVAATALGYHLWNYGSLEWDWFKRSPANAIRGLLWTISTISICVFFSYGMWLLYVLMRSLP